MSRWSVALAAVAAAVAATLACRQDPGIDIVRVPAGAYLPPDAAPVLPTREQDAGRDADVFMVCVDAPAPDSKADEDQPDDESSPPDMSSDFSDCPMKLGERKLDPRVTQRHRDKGQEQACCYRAKGSPPQPVRSGAGE